MNQPGPVDQDRSKRSARSRARVTFVTRPRLTIGPDGGTVQFEIMNSGPASVDVGFVVRVDGREVLVEKPSLSLNVGDGRRTVTLEVPADPTAGTSPSVSVTATNSAGQTLAVGTTAASVVSAPLLVGGLLAVSVAGVLGFQALRADPAPADAGLGTGDVQVTLEWSEPVDLDLHVVDPDGQEISFQRTTSSSGGVLDVDACATDCAAGQHVENVFWPEGEAPSGDYATFVEHFRGDVEAAYELTIRVDGEPDRRIVGRVGPDERSEVAAFSR